MRILSLVLAGALMMSAVPSVAAPSQPTPAAKSDDVCFQHHTPGAKVVKVECHDPQAVTCIEHARTGSRIVSTECHTRQVWDQMTQQAQQDTEDVQHRSNFMLNP